MDLRDRGGGDRFFVKGCEQRRHVLIEGSGERRLDLGEGKGLEAVLQAR